MRSMTAMVSCGVAVAALLAAVPPVPARAAASQLVVDLAAGTGALRYGATGFLYGLGDEGATNYNSNIVDRYADISVNGGAARRAFFRNTLGWSIYRTTVVDVDLVAGPNTITFGNSSSGYAPNVDLIQIAAPVG